MSDAGARIFVGRRRELGEMRAGVGEVAAGHGRLFLVSGEAGMGKSRIAAEVAREAGERGFVAVWGRCWESGGAPAYWPWRQLLRACLRTLDVAALEAARADAAGELAALAPELAGGVEAPAGALDTEHARFRLFEAVTGFLRRAAAAAPMVLVIDDLHAADADSLLLLRFLSRDLQATRLLVVGTYREVEAQRSESVGPLLVDLLRDAAHLPLRGLSESEVGEFIALATAPGEGSTADQTLVTAVSRLTEGNPLFVSEIVRLWAAEGAEPAHLRASAGLAVPEGVRETVRRRLRVLDEGTLEVLRRAAVIGREFDRRVLDRVVAAERGGGVDLRDGADGRVAAALAAAFDAAVVAEVAGESQRAVFAHVLFRDTLYADLDVRERAAIHRRVAAATEAVFHAEIESYLDDVAHHHLEAAIDGDVDEAIHHARRAAERAQAMRAYEDAVELRRRALHAFDGRADAASRPEDALGRCRLLLDLGASLDAAGRLAESKRAFLDAFEVAQREGAAEELAQAAVGFGGSWLGSVEPAEESTAPGLPVLDDTLVRLLRTAIDALAARGHIRHPLRARALARLAVELNFTEPLERRRALAEEAVAIARALDDRVTLARVLCDAHIAIWHLSTVEERSRMADEILALAAELRAPDLELTGRGWRIGNLFEAAECAEMEAEVDRYRRAAEFSGQRRALWALKTHLAMRALLTGSFQEAKRLSREALALGDSRAGAAFAVQLTAIRRELGDVDKLMANEPMLRWAAEAYPMLNELRVQLATTLLLAGRIEEARGELDRIAAHGFTDVRQDPNWANTLCEAAEIVVALGDRERARALYDLLRPYERCNALGLLTTFSWGAIARTLGRLAACDANWEAAEAHFAVALELNRRLRSRPWIAHTECALAEMLSRRGAPGDRARSRELLARARATADALGMRPLVARCDGLLATDAAAAEDGLPPSSAAPPLGGVFRREGDVWRIEYAGHAVQLRHQRGFAFLAALLAFPGREVSALDLVAGPAPSAGPAPGARDELAARRAGDAGEQLDARALDEYRRRAADLAAELDEAEAHHDVGRAERLREELDFLSREVERAVGLGGRVRRAGSPLERARINVSRAVSEALRKIEAAHPALGSHLAETVRTGTFCAYRPDPRVPIEWQG